jgi:hypothetical protein
MPLRRLVRHDDRAASGEHAADAMADRDLGAGDLGGAVPRIWRTLSCSAYMPYMPECMKERPPPLVLSGYGLSSPPRKRGSRRTAETLVALDSRFRGNDG